VETVECRASAEGQISRVEKPTPTPTCWRWVELLPLTTGPVPEWGSRRHFWHRRSPPGGASGLLGVTHGGSNPGFRRERAMS
jgi:hypothetical protein